jgi:hypothetical protein
VPMYCGAYGKEAVDSGLSLKAKEISRSDKAKEISRSDKAEEPV